MEAAVETTTDTIPKTNAKKHVHALMGMMMMMIKNVVQMSITKNATHVRLTLLAKKFSVSFFLIIKGAINQHAIGPM
jgi:hypothetical protein